MRALIRAGETSVPVLTIAKLANVGLSMLWGFAVTFVFARALPGLEFQAFLLLIAFNNFTQSAEFGLTNVIYARLRRYWLAFTGHNGDDGGAGDFRPEEIGVLFLFLGALVVVASVGVAIAIHLEWIKTGLPAIFLIFFISSALNMLLLLARRTLAAVDLNLLWEAVDFIRRVMGLAILFAVLGGFDLLQSVALQLLLNGAAIMLGMAIIRRRIHMKGRQWFAWRSGATHVRQSYLRDIGASAALTLSEVAAYNAPYFLIAGLSHDPRLMLIFDFAFKMIRAITTSTRAMIEGLLPRLTRYWFARDRKGFRKGVIRALCGALGLAVCANIVLIAIGERLFDILFDGRTEMNGPELVALCGLLVLLSIMSVSVCVHGALGRFGSLLRLSVPFLIGTLISVPLTLKLAEAQSIFGHEETLGQGTVFMALYALVFAGSAALHGGALRRLVKAV